MIFVLKKTIILQSYRLEIEYNMPHVHKTPQQKTEEYLALLRSTKRDKIEDLIHQTDRQSIGESTSQHHPGRHR